MRAVSGVLICAMEQSLVTSLFLPLALGIIMLGMGMTLVIDDFKRVILFPKAAITGICCQMILLPALGFGLAILFRLPPELAVGLVLLSLCPGGATSNIVSHLARADLALSVTLTAVSSIVTIFTIPIFLNIALFRFMGGEQAIQLPVLATIAQIFIVTVLPVACGMCLARKLPRFTQKVLPAVNWVSASFFVLILLLAILKERANLLSYFQQAGMAALCLNASGMALGYFAGRALALAVRQRLTIAIETGIQNGTLAIGIALSPLILNNSQMAIPAAIYSLIMFVTAGVVIFASRMSAAAPVPAEVGSVS